VTVGVGGSHRPHSTASKADFVARISLPNRLRISPYSGRSWWHSTFSSITGVFAFRSTAEAKAAFDAIPTRQSAVVADGSPCPRMVARGWGRIVNIHDGRLHRHNGAALYGSSKALQLLANVGCEWATGVAVVAIAPGPVRTPGAVAGDGLDQWQGGTGGQVRPRPRSRRRDVLASGVRAS
jgi:NAD(P)-dependent dehydrogenase (short-subunit alcohol dehydrogenase family)